MYIRRLLFFAFLFILVANSISAQDKKETFLDIGMKNLSFGYGVEFPFADLNERYGRYLKFTLGAERLTKSNWIYGYEFSYMFGNNIKEDPLTNLRLPNGEILGADNAYADVFLRGRGLFTGLNIGKLIPLNEKSRSGLRITGAAGILLNYIRIKDEASSVPQIEGDYLKGYDRLTRGFALREFVGYQHVSENKRVNYYIGIEFTQGFTTSVRDVNFDTGQLASKERRFDGIIGLKAAWILPFHDDYVDEEVFY